MFVYVTIYILTILGFVLFYKKRNSRNSNLFFYILSAFMLLVVALRGENIGYDTHTYMERSLSPLTSVFSPYEPVLQYFYVLLGYIYHNKYFINFVVAIISLTPIYYIIKKYSNNFYYSIFLYFSFSIASSLFVISLAAVRQTLAIGFFALAIDAYVSNHSKYNKKLILFLLLMIFTHISSFLVIILFLLMKIRITKKIYVSLAIVASILGLFMGNYLDVIMTYAEEYEKGFYVSGYTGEGSIRGMIPFLGSFIFVIYKLPETKLQTIWVKGFFMSVILSGLCQTFAVNLDRICAYYYLLACLAIPMCLDIPYKSVHDKLFSYMVNCIIWGYFSYKYFIVWFIVSGQDYSPVPYSTFFQ